MRNITVDGNKLTIILELGSCKYCKRPMLSNYDGDSIRLKRYGELTRFDIQVEDRDHYGTCYECKSTNKEFQERCDSCDRMFAMPEMILKLHHYLKYDSGVDTLYLCKECHVDGKKVLDFIHRDNYHTCEIQRDGEWEDLF